MRQVTAPCGRCFRTLLQIDERRDFLLGQDLCGCLLAVAGIDAVLNDLELAGCADKVQIDLFRIKVSS